MSFKWLATVFIFAHAFSGFAAAGAILSPVAVVSNSASTPGLSPIESTIDQDGLATGFVSGVTDFDTYVALNPLHTWLSGEWFAASGENTATIIYDLGATYDVSRLALWNEDNAGVSGIEISACPDATCGVSTLLGTFNPVDSPLDTDYVVQVFNLTDASTRYIKAIVNGPSIPFVFDGISMAEIAFDVEAAIVPAPMTVALLGLGLAAIGFKRRKPIRAA